MRSLSISCKKASLVKSLASATGRRPRLLRFVANESEIRTNALQGLTLIRLPEMYYILAESLYDTDATAAKAALDEVRKSRGLLPVADAKLLTKDALAAVASVSYKDSARM